MKIVVIGGTGLIGKKVVTNFRQHGHEAVAASPSSGVNTVTGEGLAEALDGTQGYQSAFHFAKPVQLTDCAVDSGFPLKAGQQAPACKARSEETSYRPS